MFPARSNSPLFKTDELKPRSNTPLSQALYNLADGDAYEIANNADVRDIIRSSSTTRQITIISSLIKDTNTSIALNNQQPPSTALEYNRNLATAREGFIETVSDLFQKAILEKEDMTLVSEHLFLDTKKRQDFLLKIQQVDATQPFSLASLGVTFDQNS